RVVQGSASGAEAGRTRAAGGALAGLEQFSGLWPGLLSLPLARHMAKRGKKQRICPGTREAHYTIRRNLSLEETRMKRVVLAGGSGFLGRLLARHFLTGDYEV